MTVVIGVYLTIMIANMGGYVDQIMRNDIRDRITQQFAANPPTQNMDPETRAEADRRIDRTGREPHGPQYAGGGPQRHDTSRTP